MDTVALPDGVLKDVPWLQGFAERLARDADEADELVQDTLVEAWRNPPRDHGAPLRPWLATVLRNRLRMRRRSQGRREARQAQGVSSGSEARSPEAEQERLEVLRILVEQLQGLAPEDQRIIVRRFFDDESAADIGRALGVPPATIRSRIHRSLARLRSSLDDRYGSRQAWCAAVLAVPSGAAPLATQGSSSTMSITAKAIILTTTLGTAGLAGYVALDSKGAAEPASGTSATASHVGTAEVGAPTAAEPSPAAKEPTSDEPRARWAERRSSIRGRLAPSDGASKGAALEGETEAGEGETEGQAERAKRIVAEHHAFRELVDACLDDLGSKASGSLTLDVHEIGAPGVGKIYESVEIIDATVDDPEVVECVTQSMYAYVGPEPEEPYERVFRRTSPIGEPPPGDDKDRQTVGFIVGAHIGEVKFCETKAEGEVAGTLTVSFAIDETGMAEGLRVAKSELPAAVVECIVAATKRWKFPSTLAGKRFEREFVLPLAGRSFGDAKKE